LAYGFSYQWRQNLRRITSAYKVIVLVWFFGIPINTTVITNAIKTL